MINYAPMITDDDVKKLSKVFVTKKEFSGLKNDVASWKEENQEAHDVLAIEIFKTKEELKGDIARVENKFDSKFDQVMIGLDKVLVEVQAVRQEQVVHQAQHEDIANDLASIKSIPVIAHALKR